MGAMRHAAMSVFIAAGVLSLAACSGPGAGPEIGSGPAQGGQARDGRELQTVLQDFAQGQPRARILDDAQLRESIPEAEAWLKGLQVNPEECGLTITGPLATQLEQASMTALQLEDSFITLASYADAGQVARNFEDQEQRNERCARYTVLKDGHHVAFHMARQPIETEAERSAAHVLTSSDGSGASQQVTMQAADGNILITINQPLDRQDQPAQLARLSGEVNRLLEIIEEQ